jgi:hypothetical protein
MSPSYNQKISFSLALVLQTSSLNSRKASSPEHLARRIKDSGLLKGCDSFGQALVS